MNRRERIENLRRQIPPADRERLWRLRNGVYLNGPGHGLRDEDRIQAKLRSLKACNTWLAMSPADRQAWYDRVEAYIEAQVKWAEEFRQARRLEPATVLGVTAGATRHEIKAAYRRLARSAHPDAGGNPEAFKALHVAYRAAMAKADKDNADT